MTEVDEHASAEIPGTTGVPASLLAAATALGTIDAVLRQACTPDGPEPADAVPERVDALDALLLLRDVSRRLAAWEPSLIEVAREAGASWAEIAQPLGVTSRQAAERRYLRLRTGPLGTTGEQRVQATRDRRAANRTVAAWARDNAADLRRLAGRITSLTDLPERAVAAVDELNDALGGDDPARLVGPLADARLHLEDHRDLADRIDHLVQQVDNLRRHTASRRRGVTMPPERQNPGTARR
ncbi:MULTISPECIES: hypothetical protein [unclassified Streptomyces]|uniref:hypothetical protein n=1 Tax=unclassified Streptomyces TaxID=2593676 RepID=UPI00225126E8|nr:MULTISPECIES: hypothetical protein [unclassified Streptomyces]WSP53410.1 hypothetical protein OG306_02555 [Streptomyces sp. NBC_01241]MCX4784780.1 hypothetical protein [Streptomyces sp. NBC_01221]MCX4799262.1 hypothetical protein [Streptomyces sp. NBC_01242]WSJ40445.1 hypothetical protein OG772_33745 [Streptomyces sp. NBC_01321]WSP66762.1 hypothetical protein OG466_36490 [Streptomyces sp. NBC_01240]